MLNFIPSPIVMLIIITVWWFISFNLVFISRCPIIMHSKNFITTRTDKCNKKFLNVLEATIEWYTQIISFLNGSVLGYSSRIFLTYQFNLQVVRRRLIKLSLILYIGDLVYVFDLNYSNAVSWQYRKLIFKIEQFWSTKSVWLLVNV